MPLTEKQVKERKYIGLRDRDKKKIYENDIVEFMFTPYPNEPETKMIDLVKISKDGVAYFMTFMPSLVKASNWHLRGALATRYNKRCKVIGDVFNKKCVAGFIGIQIEHIVDEHCQKLSEVKI